MGTISGERSVEIEAPIERCYEIASDIGHAPEWQGSLKDAEVLERDGQKRALVVETESDAKVKTVRATLRFSYEEPTAIRWVAHGLVDVRRSRRRPDARHLRARGRPGPDARHAAARARRDEGARLSARRRR
jgi:hypothetical protein